MKQICRKCTAIRDLEDFHKDKHGLWGHRAICKECVSAENKKFNRKRKLKLAQREREKKLIRQDFGSFAKKALQQRFETEMGAYSIDQEV